MPLELLWKHRLLTSECRTLKSILKGLSYGYKALIHLNHRAYDTGWFKTGGVAIPVISVGNIAVGGVGKTPLVRFLAEAFPEIPLAILSRGYRAALPRQKEPILLSEGRDSAEQYGDEPHLLKHYLPNSLIFVGKNRLRAAEKAVENGAKLILIDDGMQHRRLRRAFEVVVIDGKDPLGGGYFLPRGVLRDHPKRLSVADLIVATRIENRGDYEKVAAEIAPYTTAPLLGMKLIVEGSLLYKKVGLFCAIGNPERFNETALGLGGVVIDRLYGADHRPFSKRQLEDFSKSCQQKGAELLICTEKDWVKLPPGLHCHLPIQPIKVRFAVTVGQEQLQTFIEKVKRKL
jgi:tetraacyldisaccharide 4'-kinase